MAEEGLTSYLVFVIFTAVLGMFQFGYHTGVINSPEKSIENYMVNVTDERGGNMSQDEAVRLFSVAVSIFAIGGMIGGFSGGYVANKFGRKRGLLYNNSLGLIGNILMAVTKETSGYEGIFVGRFIIGLHCGLNTSIIPMYISEISPINLRGALGTVNQLAVTIGLFISQILGIEQIFGNDYAWPYLLGFGIIFLILQTIFLPFCQESPRYLLITKQNEEEARISLKRLRGKDDIEEYVEEMREEQRAHDSEASVNILQLFQSKLLRRPLIVGIVMHLSQQFSGINAVFYYSTNLFLSSGLSEDSAKFVTIGIGIIMVVMTLVSIPLMDRAGRRTLHLWGLGGMFVFSIILTMALLLMSIASWMTYVSVIATLCFVVFFAVGPGSIPWMITAELFSQGPRPAAMSVSVLVNWLANFIVGIGFPSMKNALGNFTFVPFIVFLGIFWMFTYKKVPETKNKTFEEISALFRVENGENLTNYGATHTENSNESERKV